MFMGLAGQENPVLPNWFYGWLFVFYFVQYFIIIFFNTALVGAAIARLSGADPTVMSALALAAQRIVPILGYAAVSATVGVALRWIGEKFGFIGRLIEGSLGLAWTVATFLVVPVLAAEGVGPLKAIERSGELLSQTWGENLVGNAGIAVVTSLISVVFVFAAAAGVYNIQSGNEWGYTVVGFSVVILIAIFLISATLSGIYQAAVYYYALTGNPPPNFDASLIRDSFARKEASA
jgi:hydrogenase-4 membrane subunit HyfE